MIADLVFGVGSLILSAGMLPAAFNRKTRIPLKTSLPVGLVISSYVITFAAIGFWFAAASEVIGASCWLFIAAKRRL